MGGVVLYADVMTGSLRFAIEETDRRRAKQSAWNAAHGITPKSVRSHIGEVLGSVFEQDYVTVSPVKDAGVTEMVGKDLKSVVGRAGEADAGGGGGPGVRDGGAAARRDQAAGGAGAWAAGAAGECRVVRGEEEGPDAGAAGAGAAGGAMIRPSGRRRREGVGAGREPGFGGVSSIDPS